MNRIRRWGTNITLPVLILLFPFSLRAELLDRIVAAVNNDVITASELSCAIAINLRLVNADKDRMIPEATTLEGLIDQRLLIQEAHRLKFVEVSDQELSAEVGKLRDQFASEEAFGDFLAALDMGRQELARMLGEKLLVERFVKKKIGLFVRVGREDALNYFNGHAAEFKNERFQDVQKMILALLTKQQVGVELGQYLAEIRGKADIRMSAH